MIEFLEISERDLGNHEAGEPAKRIVDTPCHEGVPFAARRVSDRCTDECGMVVVGAEVGEEVAAGDIDRYRRPSAGGVRQPSIGIDQRH